MSRFFVSQDAINDEVIIVNKSSDVSHIRNVLRLGVGDGIDISDNKEWEYETEIISIEEDSIKTKIIDKQKFSREPSTRITLVQSLPKQKKMDEIIQKSIELGVSEIVPVFTSRSIIDQNTPMKNKLERWQRIASETVKQCRRGLIPNVNEVLKLDDFIKTIDEYDLVLLPYEEEMTVTIKDCLRSLSSKPKNIAIIIGPEGGFDSDEADILIDNNAVSVSLGRTILRTETAGPAAIAMVMYELELD
jgi:16S rRNA (uracil1498-N3)-methyltransferase